MTEEKSKSDHSKSVSELPRPAGGDAFDGDSYPLKEKLKTLKELPIWETNKYPPSFNFIRWVQYDELRAEAIGWIKHLENPKEVSKVAGEVVSGWIMHFFDLTEEDLKNGE